MKTLYILFLSFFILCLYACSIKNGDTMHGNIKAELTTIDSLLKDTAYNAGMAKALEAAYYTATGQPVPPFPGPDEDTLTKARSVKEEKIATNIAGFYALECGIGWLCAQTNTTPVEWLEKINTNSLDSGSISLLNRFANATWKAGQPFRDMNRITRPTFSVFNFLPPGEVKKDYDQIIAAAAKLLSSMHDIADSNTDVQMQRIRKLMQSKDFTLEMAEAIHTAYYMAGQGIPPKFLTPADDTVIVTKSIKDEKIAANVAGFYALECGLNYFAASRNILPSGMLRSIMNDSINNDDKKLLVRFANATWKAGRPFRDLDRIERENFVPFYFLDEKEIEKDWIQIKAATEKLLKDIQ